VGELRLLVERLQVLHPGATITPRHLPAAVGGDPAKGGVLIEAIPTSLDLRQAVDQFERNFIERVIAEEGGNKAAAARRLGVARETLWEKTRG
jgi:two-component system nitrogen regulation response regulator NtrX